MHDHGKGSRARIVPFKTKLTTAFILIVCVMGAISAATFVTMRLSLRALDDMVEVVILSNRISVLAGTPTVGLPHFVELYSTDPSDEKQKLISDQLTKLKAIFPALKPLVKHANSLASLEGIQNMTSSIEDNFAQVKEKLATKAPFSEVNDATSQIKDVSLFISEAVWELIGQEAEYDQNQKAMLDGRTTTMGIGVILAVLLVSVASVIGAVLFSVNVSRPLVYVADTLRGISKGEGDLSTRLEVARNDEIGLLASHFNDFLEAQNRIIGQIKEVTTKSRDMGSDLAASSEESATSLEEISRNMESMKNKISFLDEEINKSNHLADEVQEFISRLDVLMNSQSSAISESSVEVQEMFASMRTVASSSEAKREASVKLNETARMGEKMMADTIEIIKKVTDSTSVIMDLVDVIANTSRQTNILAMNASIEAAHAGDSGRGFAVVAEEIRNLAESTDESSKGISKSLGDLVKYMQTSRESIGKTGSIFTDIVTGVSDISASMTEMKTAIEELSQGSAKIMETLGSLLKVTEEVKSSYASVHGNIQSISASLSQIGQISTETKTGMLEVTQGVGELHSMARLVSDSGVQNVENISRLGSLVDKFKVDSFDAG